MSWTYADLTTYGVLLTYGALEVESGVGSIGTIAGVEPAMPGLASVLVPGATLRPVSSGGGLAGQVSSSPHLGGVTPAAAQLAGSVESSSHVADVEPAAVQLASVEPAAPRVVSVGSPAPAIRSV